MNGFYFILISLFWGGSFLAIKTVVTAIPPVFGAALRVLAAAIFLAAIQKSRGRGLAVPRPVRHQVWLAGFFSAGLPFLLLFWGEKSISPGLASILNGTVPIWAFALGHFMLPERESQSARKLAGVILGVAGLLIIFLPKVSYKGTGAEAAGTFAVILMAVSYGAGAVLNRALFQRAEKVELRASLFQQQCSSFVFLAAASFLSEGIPALRPALSGRVLAAVLYLGWGSTALGFMMYYHLIRAWGAVRASAVTYIVPINAILLDFLARGAWPRPPELAGCACIVGGVVLIQWTNLIGTKSVPAAVLSPVQK